MPRGETTGDESTHLIFEAVSGVNDMKSTIFSGALHSRAEGIIYCLIDSCATAQVLNKANSDAKISAFLQAPILRHY